MNKLITMLITGAIITTASADLTTFNWAGGTAGDAVAGDYVFTILDNDATADIWSFVHNDEIDILDLMAFSVYNVQNAAIAPPFLGETWGGAEIVGDGSAAGQYAYAIIAGANFFSVGDTINIATIAGPINELQPDATPAATGQIFNPGSASSVQVVPEPATALLFGIGGMGAFIIRRNKKAKEEAEA